MQEEKQMSESTEAVDTQKSQSTGTENNTPEVITTRQTPEKEDEFPDREIPLNQPLNDGSVEMSYKDALHLDNPQTDIEFEVVDSVGRGGVPKFQKNNDLDRKVKIYNPKGGIATLWLKRNSENKSEGGTIAAGNIELNFDFRFFAAPNKTQVTLVLINGKELVGYLSKGAKGGKKFYFPKNLAEQVIDLPAKGKSIKILVAKLAVG